MSINIEISILMNEINKNKITSPLLDLLDNLAIRKSKQLTDARHKSIGLGLVCHAAQ